MVKWDDEPRSAGAIVESMARANQIIRSEPTGPAYICFDAGLQESALEEEIDMPDIADYQPSDPLVPHLKRLKRRPTYF